MKQKKILNLRIRWHILRSYRFVVDVTINESNFWFQEYRLTLKLNTEH